jgi:ATP phosphoribosyltransferase regulatory subunit
MNDADLWLLPEGVEEILPPSARRLELLRRKLLDLFDQWGYELVIPPLIEFLESLLIGAGNDLNLQTFKLTDQLSGRMMGVPADMTPQVARIDAHHLRRNGPTRLCYMGPVLRTRSDGLGGSRNPFQIGTELYGHRGYESDFEVLCLMLETLKVAEVADIHLDLGHVAIFKSLVQQAGLDSSQESLLFTALQHKALPEIHEHLRTMGLPSGLRDTFLALAELNGGEETLPLAERLLGATDERISQALETLHQVTARIQHRWPGIPINFDLAELRGYRYHTGLVFAAYVPGQGQALAKGGRYDNIARAFGRTRPATGFSTDLRSLLALAAPADISAGAIYAPRADDPTLEAMINELRGRGERVICALPGSDPGPEALDCDRTLIMEGETWVVVPSGRYTEDRK